MSLNCGDDNIQANEVDTLKEITQVALVNKYNSCKINMASLIGGLMHLDMNDNEIQSFLSELNLETSWETRRAANKILTNG